MDDVAFRGRVEAVRDHTDLVALIGETVPLSPAGSVLKGRSPWARDSEPSLVVWPHTRTWRDFSSAGPFGGDCFDWVERRDGVPFIEALRILAKGTLRELPGPADPTLQQELARISERRRVEGLLSAAAAYYHGVLPSKVRHTWYRERYGFDDAIIDTLLLGWSDGHLYPHLTELLGASQDEALSTGLFVRLKGGRIADFFSGRLVFPYWRSGRVVYFIARRTEHTEDTPWEQAKYKKLLTHSERHPYVSTYVTNATFYNEDAAHHADTLLITEGVTDCISAMQLGVPCISPVTVRFRQQDHEKLIALTQATSRVIICNDAEESGAGEAGALATAQALYAAGRDVRIAAIPRPPGKPKVDLNEVAAKGGAKALNTILEEAKVFPEWRIERIPQDLPKVDLAAALKPVIALLQEAEPLVREACADRIKARFKLKAATVKALLRPSAKTASKATRSAAAEMLRGEVFEDTDHYYVCTQHGDPVIISSFHIEPIRRILTEDGEIIDADVVTDQGRVLRNLRFPRECWHSKRHLLRVLTSVDLQWTGSDENVQGVLRLLASRPVPTLAGTTNLGYIETQEGSRWVSPDGVLSTQGEAQSNAIVYVPTGASLHKRTRYKPPQDPAVEMAAAAIILPNLLELNTSEVVLPVLGWFFAAPLKPRIHPVLGHFPILCVWGTQGSGKSSLIMEVFWPLLGVASSEPFSATETEFALLKLLSSTNSVPVFIDEYKPFDMPRHRLHVLHRTMRRLYTGETEERGRANQTLQSYRLSSPLCLAGETRPIEPAMVERILTANPDKNTLQQDARYAQAFGRLKQVNPNVLSASIVRFLLARDTEADLACAKALAAHLLQGCDIPFRVRDNLTVMLLGLHVFEEYTASYGIALPDLDVETAVTRMLDDLLEGGGSQVKSGLDYFLEELSVMAIAGTLMHGRHYVYYERHLALHFASCHAAYCEHMRRTGTPHEVLDRKALRRQLQENHRRGGYVVDAGARVCFNGRDDRRRAVLIDMERAQQCLDLDDFAVPTTATIMPPYHATHDD